jgi:hypothetical protein
VHDGNHPGVLVILALLVIVAAAMVVPVVAGRFTRSSLVPPEIRSRAGIGESLTRWFRRRQAP